MKRARNNNNNITEIIKMKVFKIKVNLNCRKKFVSLSLFIPNLDEIDDDDDTFEVSEKSRDKEHYLRSLYGSLSSTMKYVQEIYQSKSSQLR